MKGRNVRSHAVNAPSTARAVPPDGLQNIDQTLTRMRLVIRVTVFAGLFERFTTGFEAATAKG